MPELPEIETIIGGLKPIIGLKIIGVTRSEKNLRIVPPHDFDQKIVNQSIKKIARRSKYILLHLSNAEILVLHLGMSGRVKLGANLEVLKHDHLRLSLSNQYDLILNDPRRFGLYTVISNAQFVDDRLFCNLGIEPLTSEFRAEYLQKKLKNKRLPIKAAIMDAALVVGVGNIYASESLFRAKINPLRPANSLSLQEYTTLCSQIISVLEDAINAGGSTLRDYIKASGEVGDFQNYFKVYGRAGKSCIYCDDKISQQRIAGRSTFYCSNCQF